MTWGGKMQLVIIKHPLNLECYNMCKKKYSKCVIVAAQQHLHRVFCLVVAFFSLSHFLNREYIKYFHTSNLKLDERVILNFTNFVILFFLGTCGFRHFCRTTKSG